MNTVSTQLVSAISDVLQRATEENVKITEEEVDVNAFQGSYSIKIYDVTSTHKELEGDYKDIKELSIKFNEFKKSRPDFDKETFNGTICLKISV